MLRLRSVTALAALAATVTACATVPRAPDDGGPAWLRGDSAHLYVETDLGSSGARELAHDLELWRLAMTAALFESARPPRKRLEVIALRVGELAALNPSLQGAFGRLSADDAPTLVLGPDRPGQRTEIMRHELAHAVINENLNGVPRWLNEGLASLLATADLDEGTGLVTWGHLEIHDAHITQYDLAPLDDLLDDVWPIYDIGRYELSAAYLARTLAIEHPRELKCLLEHLAGTDGYDAALEACFPERRAWSVEYAREQFRKDENVGRVRLTVPPTDAAVAVRPMSDAEVHGAIARLEDIVASTMPMTDDRRTELQAAADKQRARAGTLGTSVPSPSPP
jgi:hypothetical protein